MSPPVSPWLRKYPNLESRRVGANVTDTWDEKAGKPRVSLAEGLAELTQRALGSIASPARREHYRIYIHLDTDGGWLTGQPRLPRHVVESMTCDVVLQPVWETDGAPVNVGRSQRTVPARLRRLLDDRDRGCRYPGCPAIGHTDKHHIIHWLHGGPTDTCNLLSLCPGHHDAHHRGEFTITGNADLPEDHPDAVRFHRTADRTPIAYRHPQPTSPAAPLPAGTPYVGPTGERMYARNVEFIRRP